jgi:hypothetical protein
MPHKSDPKSLLYDEQKTKRNQRKREKKNNEKTRVGTLY